MKKFFCYAVIIALGVFAGYGFFFLMAIFFPSAGGGPVAVRFFKQPEAVLILILIFILFESGCYLGIKKLLKIARSS